MPATDKYTRFDEMPKERLKELREMLGAGHPCSRLARTIRNDWGYCIDVKEQTLERQLQRYREDCRTNVSYCPKKREAGDDYKLNLLRLREIIEIQENRVHKIYGKELQLGSIVMGTVSKELKLFSELVEKAMKLHHDADRLKVVEKGYSINDYEENIVKIRVTDETMRRIEEVTADNFFDNLNKTASPEKAVSKLTLGKKKENYTSPVPISVSIEPSVAIN